MQPPSYNSIPQEDHKSANKPPPYAAHYTDVPMPIIPPNAPSDRYQTAYPHYPPINNPNNDPNVQHQQPTTIIHVSTQGNTMFCPRCQCYIVPVLENSCLSANGLLAVIFCLVGLWPCALIAIATANPSSNLRCPECDHLFAMTI